MCACAEQAHDCICDWLCTQCLHLVWSDCGAAAKSSHTHAPNTPRFLDVSFNELSSLPPALACCSSLGALNLAFNPLGPGLPEAVCALGYLTELNLDYTGARMRCEPYIRVCWPAEW